MKKIRFGKLIGQIGAMGLLLAFTGCTGHQRIHQPQEAIISVANDPKGIEKWMLEDTRGIESPTHVVLALVSKNREVDKYPVMYHTASGYSHRTAKNILFIDGQSNKSSWLFPKNSQLIEEYFSFPRDDYSPFMNNKKSESKFISYRVIDSDTNGDGKVTTQDNKNLAISDTAGKNYKVIIKNISRLISMKELSNDVLTIVYQKAGVGYSMSLHFKGFTVLSNEVLPKVGE